MRRVIQGVMDKVKTLARVVHIHETYQDVFTNAPGREVLRHLMKISHFFESSYVPGDPTATAFREGQRHLVLSILKAVNKDTSELIKMVEEELEQP